MLFPSPTYIRVYKYRIYISLTLLGMSERFGRLRIARLGVFTGLGIRIIRFEVMSFETLVGKECLLKD